MIGNAGLWDGYTEWECTRLKYSQKPVQRRNLEYYSERSILTGAMGANVYRQAVAHGLVVAGSAYFAFNDQETNRDGVAVFLGEQAARENELRGFQIAFRDGNETA